MLYKQRVYTALKTKKNVAYFIIRLCFAFSLGAIRWASSLRCRENWSLTNLKDCYFSLSKVCCVMKDVLVFKGKTCAFSPFFIGKDLHDFNQNKESYNSVLKELAEVKGSGRSQGF